MWQNHLVVGLVAVMVVSMGVTAATSTPFDLSPNDRVSVGTLAITGGPSPHTTVEHGEPAIDLSTPDAGINPGMRLTIGDPNAPADDHAFAVTNTADHSTVVRIHYSYAHERPPDAGVTLTVVDAMGTPVGSSHEGELTFELASGVTAYVIVTVDATGAGPTDDLSGTLTFSSRERPTD